MWIEKHEVGVKQAIDLIEALGDDASVRVLPVETYSKREQKWLRKLAAAAAIVRESWCDMPT